MFLNPLQKSRKDARNRDGSGSEVSPPGTPPPPYHQNASLGSISAAQTNIEQRPIISFDDCENVTDDETSAEDDGIFRSISMLTAPENVSYLVVFLNYVLSNSKPAPVLFYLITDLYKKGNVKDMRKWVRNALTISLSTSNAIVLLRLMKFIRHSSFQPHRSRSSKRPMFKASLWHETLTINSHKLRTTSLKIAAISRTSRWPDSYAMSSKIHA